MKEKCVYKCYPQLQSSVPTYVLHSIVSALLYLTYGVQSYHKYFSHQFISQLNHDKFVNSEFSQILICKLLKLICFNRFSWAHRKILKDFLQNSQHDCSED